MPAGRGAGAKYEQLAWQLREQIRAGTWRVGDRLPSLRQKAEQSGFSLMTVLSAYQLLESQGWIVSRPQSGYFVAPARESARETLPRQRLQPLQEVDINAFIFDLLQAGDAPDCVALGSAFPDASLFPRQQLARALARVARQMLPTGTRANLPPGCEPLRRSIAQRYAARGMDVSPDEIVITSGALEALNLSLQSLTAPGDWVVVESPAFYGALQAIERHRLKAVAIATHPRDGMDLDALEQALCQYPIKACWLMTNFHNPLGGTMPDAGKQRLLALLAEHRVALIEDDVYGELYFGAGPPLPAKAWDREGRVLHCGSFSKTLATGFRIGWVAAGRQAQAIQRLQLMSTLSTSAPMQLALADYLAGHHYDKHLHTLRRTLEQRKHAFYRAIQRVFPPSARVHYAEGGYFLWIELPEQICTTRLYWRALEEGITIAPGRMFATDERYRHCFRLNASLSWNSRNDAAIRRLAELIGEQLA
ncbi:GntR family transcriptional regulator [Zobellella endophytica]|uniref:GntR family transcriptional regulator n=1 Tax=Zobellella endophytica TaxID=2116700 RepID=A0A2P7RAU1_9GAMM|nr:PLP-dependent aminotransferase family protein [Zobellella endophytica]PSJ47347.1 GntR family transcriptional regulator [Zobellella endophytica]